MWWVEVGGSGSSPAATAPWLGGTSPATDSVCRYSIYPSRENFEVFRLRKRGVLFL